eukprot:215957-Hanusia_phi.AAC.3
MIPKRQTPISSKPPEREGKVPGSDASDSGSPWSKAGNASSGNSGFTSGLPQEFQGKLQTLVDQQLMTVNTFGFYLLRAANALTTSRRKWKVSNNAFGQNRTTQRPRPWNRRVAWPILLPLNLSAVLEIKHGRY